jgi:hypothetical protein
MRTWDFEQDLVVEELEDQMVVEEVEREKEDWTSFLHEDFPTL